MQRSYQSASEMVNVAHPDRLADLLASIVINDIQHKDREKSHAAVEVFITHDKVIFSGEVKTTLNINDDYLRHVVEQGYSRAGYLPKMREFWTTDEVMLASDMKIENSIQLQSPDIALGTTDKGEDTGWNDQNISFSSSEGTNAKHLGFPMMIATEINDMLAALSFESITKGLPRVYGPDIKVVVTVKTLEDGFNPVEITGITIAIPHTSKQDIEDVRSDIKSAVETFIENRQQFWSCPIAKDCKWVINGTGRFVVHGNLGDTSMTGRKISVNHPSAGPVWSNKMIGGGSMIKPAHASDLLLPLVSRLIANLLVDAELTSYAVVGIACGIGQKDIQSIFIHGDDAFESNPEFVAKVEDWIKANISISPASLIKRFQLFDIDFSEVVERNFFGDERFVWESYYDNEELTDALKKLKSAS